MNLTDEYVPDVVIDAGVEEAVLGPPLHHVRPLRPQLEDSPGARFNRLFTVGQLFWQAFGQFSCGFLGYPVYASNVFQAIHIIYVLLF